MEIGIGPPAQRRIDKHSIRPMRAQRRIEPRAQNAALLAHPTGAEAGLHVSAPPVEGETETLHQIAIVGAPCRTNHLPWRAGPCIALLAHHGQAPLAQTLLIASEVSRCGKIRYPPADCPPP
jgi:hypothetical protein